MSPLRIVIGICLLFAGAAAGMMLAPVQVKRLPAEAPPHEQAPSPPLLSSQAARFDVNVLPAPIPPEPVAEPPAPPPDPAAGLRRYRFIGLAVSDARSAGVFERDGAATVLAAGADLEGFTLARIGSDGAFFRNDDNVEFSLPLELTNQP